MSIRDLLVNLNTVFDYAWTVNQVDALATNNGFFLEKGLLALNLARADQPESNWQNFKSRWWSALSRSSLTSESKTETLRLAYLVRSSERFNATILDDTVPASRLDKCCSFPGCSEKTQLQKDHVWPSSLGGPDFPWNTQYLCGFHNRMKANFPGLNFCDPRPLLEALRRAFP